LILFWGCLKWKFNEKFIILFSHEKRDIGNVYEANPKIMVAKFKINWSKTQIKIKILVFFSCLSHIMGVDTFPVIRSELYICENQ
jgi:hypothetical protein